MSKGGGQCGQCRTEEPEVGQRGCRDEQLTWPHAAVPQEGPGEGSSIVVCGCRLPEMGVHVGEKQNSHLPGVLELVPPVLGPQEEATSHCCLLVPSTTAIP